MAAARWLRRVARTHGVRRAGEADAAEAELIGVTSLTSRVDEGLTRNGTGGAGVQVGQAGSERSNDKMAGTFRVDALTALPEKPVPPGVQRRCSRLFTRVPARRHICCAHPAMVAGAWVIFSG